MRSGERPGRPAVACEAALEVLEDDLSACNRGKYHKFTSYMNHKLEQSQENLFFFFWGSKPKFGADSFVYLNMKVKN